MTNVEVTIKLKVDENEYGGWRSCASDVEEKIRFLIRPYFPQVETSSSSYWVEDETKPSI